MSADSTRLRFGPYNPPAVRKRDRAFCFFRDCEAVVTGWTDARMSWPRCRALHHRGGSGLLVTEELRRAIVSESAAALKHWFGVSTKAVWNWRREFGVGQLGTPGSREVVAELNWAKNPYPAGVRLTAAECRRRRRTAAELGLGQYLVGANVKRWQGRGWTAEQLALLGTAPDADLAVQLGKTRSAVRSKRSMRKVPPFQPATADARERDSGVQI